MKIYLIRHSATKGNLEKRYIGRTDESLCEKGRELLRERIEAGAYPAAGRVFTIPMRRCIETAELLYPKQEPTVIEELAECDFGKFEYKNYEELKEEPEYQMWIDSGGTIRFPGGESRAAFSKRSLEGFSKALGMCRGDEDAVFVVHGGTIMSIMEKYAIPRGEYYDFQTGNGEGYELILADVPPACGRLCSGFNTGRPGLAVSSGKDDGAVDYAPGKNYKRLPA